MVLHMVIATIRSHTTSLTNTVAILLVVTGELLIGNNVFQCPCDAGDYKALKDPSDPTIHRSAHRVYYAACFIVWPALAVFFLALAVNGNTLRCLTGYKRHCNMRRHCRALAFLFQHSVTAFVPALTWAIIVFMDGRYYECAVATLPRNCFPDLTKLNDSEAYNYAALVAENERHHAVSQILGLTFLGAGITLAGLCVLCGQLCSNLTYYQRRFMHTFRQKEMETFTQVSEDLLTTQLTKKWRRFMVEAQADDWDAISGLPQGGPVVIGNDQYYSDFHMWHAGATPIGNALSDPAPPTGEIHQLQSKLGLDADGTQLPNTIFYCRPEYLQPAIKENRSWNESLPAAAPLAEIQENVLQRQTPTVTSEAGETRSLGTQTKDNSEFQRKVTFDFNGGFEGDDLNQFPSQDASGPVDHSLSRTRPKVLSRPAQLPSVEVTDVCVGNGIGLYRPIRPSKIRPV